MRTNDVNEMIRVMEAFQNGAGIQVRSRHDEDEEDWYEDSRPVWDWYKYEYRISPHEPPYTVEAVWEMIEMVLDKYKKKIQQYDEAHKGITLFPKVLIPEPYGIAISTAIKESYDKTVADMKTELGYLIRQYPKLATEAILQHAEEIGV